MNEMRRAPQWDICNCHFWKALCNTHDKCPILGVRGIIPANGHCCMQATVRTCICLF